MEYILKYFHKLSRPLLNTLIILTVFVVIFTVSLGLFFSNYKENAINDTKVSYELSVKYYSKLMKDLILLIDKKEIENLYVELINVNPYIKDFKLSNPRYIFDKRTLLHHTSNFKDETWTLIDAQTDIYYGEIKKIDGTSYFEFIPSDKFKEDDKLIVRYQLIKNGVLKNLVVSIDLNFMEINNVKSTKIEDEYPLWFKIFYNNDLVQDMTQELKVENENLIKLNYTIDDKQLKDDLYSLVIRVFFLSVLIFLPSIIGLIIFLKYLEKRYIKKPMEYLNSVTQHTLEYKFINIDKKMFNNVAEFDDIIKNFKKLSTNIANLKNELNINKEMVERNSMIDNLTGLYDKKMFDLDMKSMFISANKGYVLSLRISKLDEISHTYGFLATDNLLISIVNCVNDVISELSKNETTFYRFHGSEFVMIAKNMDYNEVINLSQNIVDRVTTEIFKNYTLPNNIFHVAAVPFDIYGTTDSILKMAYNTLELAKTRNQNGFEIVNETDINQEALILENRVKEIVSNIDFNFDFVLDSFSYENDKLLMRELRPVLLDRNGKFLSIGAFIAACEKLFLNVDFDKEVVSKAVTFIEENQIEYKIAINLSSRSMANFEFLEFIDELVKNKKDVMSKIVFSITSYSASAFNMEFIRFVSFMNEIGMEILVKRYKPKDYPIENLCKLDITYIRIDRDLTQNIHQDLMKKHKVKNIVVYAQLNNIKILTDSVESKKDYDLLSRLDLYATSK